MRRVGEELSCFVKTGFAFYRLKVNRCCIRRGKIISRNKSILIVIASDDTNLPMNLSQCQSSSDLLPK